MYLRIHKTDGYLLSAGRQRRIIGTYQVPCRPWSGQVSLDPRSMVDVVNVTRPQAVARQRPYAAYRAAAKLCPHDTLVKRACAACRTS